MSQLKISHKEPGRVDLEFLESATSLSSSRSITSISSSSAAIRQVLLDGSLMDHVFHDTSNAASDEVQLVAAEVIHFVAQNGLYASTGPETDAVLTAIGTLAETASAVDGASVWVRRTGSSVLKTAEDTFAAFAAEHRFPWARVETVREGFDFTSPSATTTNRGDFEPRFHRNYRMPALQIRRYSEVLCAPQQYVVKDHVALPESFRLYRHQYLRNNSAYSDINRERVELRHPRAGAPRLEGSYFHLDSEWVATYGHLVTEVVSRLWAWDAIAASDSNARVLVGCPPGAEDIPSWYRETLVAYGIPNDRITVIHGPVLVDELICATPMFSNPVVAHPDLPVVWDRLSSNLRSMASTRKTADRVFISRNPSARRKCVNYREVEGVFADHGFAIVRPEEHSLADQAFIFHAADVVAGYGGSGLLNMIYGRPNQARIVIASETYDAMNEYLIASAFGDPITYAWGTSTIQHPGTWSARAFLADWYLDLDAEGDFLASVLSDLPRRRRRWNLSLRRANRS